MRLLSARPAICASKIVHKSHRTVGHYVGRYLSICMMLFCTFSCSQENQHTHEASTEDQLETATHAISGGSVEDDRTNVVGMVIQQGWAGGACSGSLIAPNLILTAQHCVARSSSEGVLCGFTNFASPFNPNEIFVTTKTQFPRFGYYGVREIIVPEEGGSFCGNDIALMILSQNIPSSEAIPLTPRLDEPVINGERFTAVGYGHTGNGEGAGTRRSIEDRRVLCSGFQNGCQDNNQGIYDNEWVGNDGTCQGDSGGPALDQTEKVVGILSRGPEGCIYPVYTDVIRYASWIREVATQAAMVGGYSPASWVTTTGGAGSDEDGDELTDRYDNCPTVSNPSQQDLDFDGIGDLCDELISGDRGGRCPVCNSCTRDEECGGQGAVCLQLEGAGVCTYPCRGQFECPDTTDCVDIEEETNYCFNIDYIFSGFCPLGYQCGGASPAPINIPEDDGACHVCDSCERGEDCASGICTSFNDGPLVCTRTCETNDDCRDGSLCLDRDGRKLCVNDSYEEYGICPEGLSCGDSTPASAGEEIINTGGEEAGGETGGAEAGGEDSGASDDGGTSDEVVVVIGNSKKSSQGCDLSESGHQSLPLHTIFLVLMPLCGIIHRRISVV